MKGLTIFMFLVFSFGSFAGSSRPITVAGIEGKALGSALRNAQMAGNSKVKFSNEDTVTQYTTAGEISCFTQISLETDECFISESDIRITDADGTEVTKALSNIVKSKNEIVRFESGSHVKTYLSRNVSINCVFQNENDLATCVLTP